MKKYIAIFLINLSCIFLLGACGKKDDTLELFRQEVDDFCLQISEIDSSINSIDAQAENAKSELLYNLDELSDTFNDFADLDFPEEFDYLESLADEAGTYMTEAVESYHEAYGEEYDPSIAALAKENYARAYKRIQIIITFLHGEEPEDVNLTME